MEKTNDGKKGGWLVGKRHYDKSGKPIGGIPAVVGDSKRPVELEGGEVIINREASKKYWRELSKINQSAGNGVPIKPQDVGADEDPEEYKEGGKVIEFNPNRLPNRRIYNYAKSIKEKYPKVWGLGGNIFGNEAFKNLERVIKRGYWTDNEEWMYIKWRSFVARHKGDYRIAGVIAMLKWVDKVDKGWEYMKNLIEAEIDKRYPKKKKGGTVVTYKNKYNKKYGYDKNESHDLSEISKDTGVSKKGLQQIYNKGVGAFNTNPQSVRPNVKSEEQWAMARVYSAVMGGKAARVDAKELKMETGGNLYHLGGDMSKHLAPNGEPSNLTHEQWHLVRTPAFKEWFGDWENSPETSSKVVDENGEPLVVYRGLQKNTDYKRTGLQYFAYDYDYAKISSKNNGGVGNVISVFLSIKNPLNFEDYNKKLFHYGIDAGYKKEGLLQISDMLERKEPYITQIISMELSGADDLAENFTQDLKTCDGFFGYDAGYYGEQFVFVTKEPTQIKLADGTNTTFDSSNADIRYEDGGSVERLISEGIVDLKMYDTTNEHSKLYGFDAKNPLYIQSIIVAKEHRNKGIGSKVMKYINDYAKKNEHDLIFGHITQKAQPNIDVIKSMMVKSGFNTCEGNNDFYKQIYADGGLIAPNGNVELAKGIKTEQEHKDTLEKIASGEITVNQAIKMTAKDHLKENPKYYTELAKIEKHDVGGALSSYALKTPNGEKSRLTYLQQILVRTEKFKEFFGDWETAAKNYLLDNKENYKVHFKNVSKVMDMSTLEPRVVYHGTRSDAEFFTFDVSMEKGQGRPYAYFAHNREYSENFTEFSQRGHTNSSGYLYECFLNVRNPFMAMGHEYEFKLKDYEGWINAITGTIALDKYQTIEKNETTKKLEKAIRAQVEDYMSSLNNEKNQFWKYMAADTKSVFKFFLISYGYDGIFYGEELLNNYDAENPKEYTNAVTIFSAKDIKLADGRNLNFNPMETDIRYEDGGSVEKPQKTMSKKDRLGSILFGEKYANGGFIEDTIGYKSVEKPMDDARTFVEQLNKKMKE